MLGTVPDHEPAREDALQEFGTAALAAAAAGELLAFAAPADLAGTRVDLNGDLGDPADLRRRSARPSRSVPSWRMIGADAGRSSQVGHVLINLAINARDAMPRWRHAHGLDGDTPTSTRAISAATCRPAITSCCPSPTPASACRRGARTCGRAVLHPRARRRQRAWALTMTFGFASSPTARSRLYSELGHGTTVRLYLPRSDGMVLRGRRRARTHPRRDRRATRRSSWSMTVGDALRSRSARSSHCGYRSFDADGGQAALGDAARGTPASSICCSPTWSCRRHDRPRARRRGALSPPWDEMSRSAANAGLPIQGLAAV